MPAPVQFDKRELRQKDCDILPLLADALPPADGLIAMLKVYMDRAAKRDATDEVMCVASVIFKPTAYKQFIRPWNRMLKAWGVDAFHAKEFYPGSGAFRRDTPKKQFLYEEDSRRIPEMIARAISRILIMACPANSVLVGVRQTGMEGAWNGQDVACPMFCTSWIVSVAQRAG